MQQISFQLSFLSPAFLGGAYPKRENGQEPSAELRASSIIGQLRWWHRFLGKRESEARIFGSASGTNGHAAGFTIRLLHVPAPVRQAVTPKSLDLARSYFLYAQEMDNGINHRSALPAGTSFDLILLNRRLVADDWKSLIHTLTSFSYLGSLGNRSRRCFGALQPLKMNGKSPALCNPASLLCGQAACSIPDNFQAKPTFSEFAIEAGNWLREARRVLKTRGLQKSRYFGSIKEKRDTRLASPILLRPWMENGRFQLLLLGRLDLLEQVSLPMPPSSSPTNFPP